MAVNAEVLAGHNVGDGKDDALHLLRHGAAIGVTQHHPAGAGIIGGMNAGHGIIGIGLVTVEEVFHVDNGLKALGPRGINRFLNGADILLQLAAQRQLDVIVPALGNEGDGIGLGLQQRLQAGIIVGGAAGAARHAKGHEPGAKAVFGGKQLGIRGIGARIAALDVIDAEIVQHAGDGLLLLHGKVDARRLRAVPERGVIEIEALFHDSPALRLLIPVLACRPGLRVFPFSACVTCARPA